MAKHIRKTFQYDLPDEYLSNESTLGLKAEWTYEGPEKIWVFVDYNQGIPLGLSNVTSTFH